eukprot:TRINITY_DN5050_c0_g1_i1.p1 TRINITY_DN5050_c0_g1~~TRINITY_DN5050_c0_g1_i1.p1  ORF type:complete len:247 (+),score=67.43 TRINITY_DN5050_c0_g1_i1:287-1027(+)
MDSLRGRDIVREREEMRDRIEEAQNLVKSKEHVISTLEKYLQEEQKKSEKLEASVHQLQNELETALENYDSLKDDLEKKSFEMESTTRTVKELEGKNRLLNEHLSQHNSVQTEKDSSQLSGLQSIVTTYERTQAETQRLLAIRTHDFEKLKRRSDMWKQQVAERDAEWSKRMEDALERCRAEAERKLEAERARKKRFEDKYARSKAERKAQGGPNGEAAVVKVGHDVAQCTGAVERLGTLIERLLR